MTKHAYSRFTEALIGVLWIAICVIFRPLTRRWYSYWGATPADLARHLPGDEIVPHPHGGYTMAIEIAKPAADVLPWLAQIGQNKGGFYSYEMLENMVGCDIHNAGRILPECRDLKVGDMLVMHPSPRAPKIPVVTVEVNRVIVYGGKPDENTANFWTFFLEENNGRTRLIVRWFYDFKPGFGNVFYITGCWNLSPPLCNARCF